MSTVVKLIWAFFAVAIGSITEPTTSKLEPYIEEVPAVETTGKRNSNADFGKSDDASNAKAVKTANVAVQTGDGTGERHWKMQEVIDSVLASKEFAGKLEGMVQKISAKRFEELEKEVGTLRNQLEINAYDLKAFKRQLNKLERIENDTLESVKKHDGMKTNLNLEAAIVQSTALNKNLLKELDGLKQKLGQMENDTREFNQTLNTIPRETSEVPISQKTIDRIARKVAQSMAQKPQNVIERPRKKPEQKYQRKPKRKAHGDRYPSFFDVIKNDKRRMGLHRSNFDAMENCQSFTNIANLSTPKSIQTTICYNSIDSSKLKPSNNDTCDVIAGNINSYTITITICDLDPTYDYDFENNPDVINQYGNEELPLVAIKIPVRRPINPRPIIKPIYKPLISSPLHESIGSYNGKYQNSKKKPALGPTRRPKPTHMPRPKPTTPRPLYYDSDEQYHQTDTANYNLHFYDYNTPNYDISYEISEEDTKRKRIFAKLIGQVVINLFKRVNEYEKTDTYNRNIKPRSEGVQKQTQSNVTAVSIIETLLQLGNKTFPLARNLTRNYFRADPKYNKTWTKNDRIIFFLKYLYKGAIKSINNISKKIPTWQMPKNLNGLMKNSYDSVVKNIYNTLKPMMKNTKSRKSRRCEVNPPNYFDSRDTPRLIETHPSSYSKHYPNSYPDPHPSSYTEPHSSSNQKPHSNSGIETHPSSYAESHPSSYEKPLPSSHPQPYPNSYAESHPSSYEKPLPSSHPEPYSSSYAEPQPSSYEKPLPSSYLKPNQSSYPEPHSSSYQKPHSNSDLETRPSYYAEPHPSSYEKYHSSFYPEPQKPNPDFQQHNVPNIQHRSEPVQDYLDDGNMIRYIKFPVDEQRLDVLRKLIDGSWRLREKSLTKLSVEKQTD